MIISSIFNIVNKHILLTLGPLISLQIRPNRAGQVLNRNIHPNFNSRILLYRRGSELTLPSQLSYLFLLVLLFLETLLFFSLLLGFLLLADGGVELLSLLAPRLRGQARSRADGLSALQGRDRHSHSIILSCFEIWHFSCSKLVSAFDFFFLNFLLQCLLLLEASL